MSDLARGPLASPRFWQRLDRRIARGVARIARPVRATLSSLDAAQRLGIAGLSARADESPSDVELGQHFGFASAPPAGLEVVAVPIGGSSAHLVVVAELDRSHRPTDLEAGETCIYNGTTGVQVRLKPGGSIELVTPSGGKVEIDATGAVVLNEGAMGVARVGDTVNPSIAMAAWIISVSAALQTLTGGSFPPPTDTTYSVATGSATVRAGG